jgi:hypothetical protein
VGNDVGLPLRRFRDRCAQRPGRDDGHRIGRHVADLAAEVVPGLYRVFGACETTQDLTMLVGMALLSC